MLTEPPRSAYDLNFAVGGIPVRVHPWFWIATAIMGLQGNDGPRMLVWLGAVFVSILIHELGHAIAIRYYGYACHVVLYSLGGLAVQDSTGRRTMPMQVIISLAGPLAGFMLAIGLIVVLQAASVPVTFQRLLINTPWFPSAGPLESYYLSLLVDDLLYINIMWGIINLLPVYPLDGGQIAQAVIVHTNGAEGQRQAAMIGVASAAIVVYLALTNHMTFLALMFAYLGYINYQMLNSWRGPSRW